MGGFLEKDEVFHISNQDYSYEQSKCKCSSYGARLATKNEITNAYNNGANWCSYGWTEGQNAFYPVQKCYYDSLMEESGFLENSDKYCGKPGLNGAIELFVDIIVLSKCNVFFNSESNVSYFVKIMNPYQKTINIQDY